MTTKKDAITAIESLLGSEGTRELAEKMFDAMLDDGEVTFDPQVGYRGWSGMEEGLWMAYIQQCS